MEWNQIGWKCKRQKKLIDFLLILCLALVVVNICLYKISSEIRYTTMADMAAEAATHTHWREVHEYDLRQTEIWIARLESENAALIQEIQSLSEN